MWEFSSCKCTTYSEDHYQVVSHGTTFLQLEIEISFSSFLQISVTCYLFVIIVILSGCVSPPVWLMIYYLFKETYCFHISVRKTWDDINTSRSDSYALWKWSSLDDAPSWMAVVFLPLRVFVPMGLYPLFSIFPMSKISTKAFLFWKVGFMKCFKVLFQLTLQGWSFHPLRCPRFEETEGEL